jgi:carboxypeptidase C (cathepsin A)
MTAIDTDEKKSPEKKPPPIERASMSRHAIEIDGRTIEYSAVAGTLFLRDADHEPRAQVFYVAYTRDSADLPSRPITFLFNGGPGSSSVWLHLGLFGPRRADVPDASAPPPPPYCLTDNTSSLLDTTDLVFVDPVGTGYSTPLGQGKPADFHGVKEDVASMAEFIRRFLTRTARWNSPRFLVGESYGSTRAAALARELGDEGIMINGMVLVSAALMFQSFVFETGNDLPYILYLPAYAATAAYHHVLPERPRELLAYLDEVQTFAIERYAPALLAGASLAEDRRRELAEQISRYIGLSAEKILKSDLRVELAEFCRELLRERGRIVGRLDSRFTSLDPEPQSPEPHDPSFTYPHGAYAALLNDYLRRELKYEEERRYEIISMTIGESWKWHDEKGKRLGFINVAKDLRRAMIANPHLKVFFANGIYDLATPYFASMHAARHLGREPQIRENVREAFYEAGHMMYLHEPSRVKLRSALVAFYRDAAPVVLTGT